MRRGFRRREAAHSRILKHPVTAIPCLSPDPLSKPGRGTDDVPPGRGTLVLRRRSPDRWTLRSRFVTLIEPVSPAIPALLQVAHISAPENVIAVSVNTSDGGEYLVVNLEPGKTQSVTLPSGEILRTDGLVVRISNTGLALAGGTFAEFQGRSIHQAPAHGRIVGAFRTSTANSTGWFTTLAHLPDGEALAGRTLLIQHGDGSTHGWTISRIVHSPTNTEIMVHEEPGFTIDLKSGAAMFYQFPQLTVPGPHEFRVSRIVRE